MAFLENISEELKCVMDETFQHNQKVVIDTVTDLPDAFHRRAIAFYPKVLKRISGHLIGSIESVKEQIDKTSWKIGLRAGGETAAYAPIQHEGGFIPPHGIKARVKKALFWEGAAHPVKRVHHPGSYIRPRKYLEFPMFKVVQETIPKLTEKLGFAK